MLQKLKKFKWEIVLFLVIIPLGIFVRTYHFSDWLRFHKDETRDAILIDNIIREKSPLPLLGPVVGNTHFKLGPMFYYFQYASAFIFGNNPDKVAYPDLFFSILSIGLLFFFLKKYFSANISLLLTALFSITCYVVRYSRFAWNPNSQPFFMMLFLYSILEIVRLKNDEKKLFWWSIAAGAALGIGVQLQALFMLSIPLLAIYIFIYLKKKKMLDWKPILMIIAVAFFLNIPQFIYEAYSHGKNTHEFIQGVILKSTKIGNIINNTECQIHANIYITTFTGSEGRCDSANDFRDLYLNGPVLKSPLKYGSPIAVGILYTVFTLGGYFLLIYFLIQEKDAEKKMFLHFLAVFLALVFILSLLLFYTMTMRFFLIVEIIPFMFLGFWIKLILKMKSNFKLVIVTAIILPLFLMNIATLKAQAAMLSGFGKAFKHDTSNLTLGEADAIARFIAANSDNSHIVYIDGANISLPDIMTALNYLPETSGLDIKSYKEKKAIEKNIPLFGFDMASNIKTGEKLSPVEKENFTISNSASHGRFSVFKLVPK